MTKISGTKRVTRDSSAKTRPAVGDGHVGERRVHRGAGVDALGDAHDVIVGQRDGSKDAPARQLLVTKAPIVDIRGYDSVDAECGQGQDGPKDEPPNVLKNI